MFGDSINGNLELVKELAQNLPPSERDQCRRAIGTVEKFSMDMSKLLMGNAAAGLGFAFGVFLLSQRLANGSGNGGDSEKSLIQLLG